LPMSSSGAAYAKVPVAPDALEKYSVIIASPTSLTFAKPSRVSSIFEDLTSLHAPRAPQMCRRRSRHTSAAEHLQAHAVQLTHNLRCRHEMHMAARLMRTFSGLCSLHERGAQPRPELGAQT
jgi:hypothetical protein